ncbi:MAG: restriction endonuclease subunit S [Gammaproteobacteria bacterium]|nr:restriction endonuclease subunit S [Gammaproteobacteria bacterium]
MAGEWSQVRLGDVAERITKGTTPTTIGGRFVDAGIAFVKVESFSDDGRFYPDKLAFIDDETNQLLSRSVLQEDDVLFTIAGTIGRVARVSREILPANTNQAVAIIRPRKDLIDPGFLYFVLKDELRVQHAHSRVVQSVQANFSLSELSGIEIPLPEMGEQRAIAHILGTLDDKIELNRRMNETLESMARVLFKSWFVDFDPVRAKAEGRDPGLPKPLADLFPDSFEDSDLGEIPKGWELRPLGKLADVNWGDTNTTKASYCESGFPAYSASGKDGFLSYHDFDITGVVVSAIGANAGETWLATGKWSCIKNTICFWATEPNITTEYLFYATHGKERWPLRGSAQPFIAQGDARSMTILVPANDLAIRFKELIRPWLDGTESRTRESATLSGIRDVLLPKLISGELQCNRLGAYK